MNFIDACKRKFVENNRSWSCIIISTIKSSKHLFLTRCSWNIITFLFNELNIMFMLKAFPSISVNYEILEINLMQCQWHYGSLKHVCGWCNMELNLITLFTTVNFLIRKKRKVTVATIKESPFFYYCDETSDSAKNNLRKIQMDIFMVFWYFFCLVIQKRFSIVRLVWLTEIRFRELSESKVIKYCNETAWLTLNLARFFSIVKVTLANLVLSSV